MKIERLLGLFKHVKSDEEQLGMIISNRITHYLGDKDGAVIASGNFELLAKDILKWHKSKAGEV